MGATSQMAKAAPSANRKRGGGAAEEMVGDVVFGPTATQHRWHRILWIRQLLQVSRSFTEGGRVSLPPRRREHRRCLP